jgi:hypothetical protein
MALFMTIHQLLNASVVNLQCQGAHKYFCLKNDNVFLLNNPSRIYTAITFYTSCMK